MRDAQVHDVVVEQVDLGRAARALAQHDVEAVAKVGQRVEHDRQELGLVRRGTRSPIMTAHGRPIDHDLAGALARRLQQDGFIAASGSTPGREGLRRPAPGRSRGPTRVTAEFSAMFCALNGATRTPGARAAAGTAPATIVVLPAFDVVPHTMSAPRALTDGRAARRAAPATAPPGGPGACVTSPSVEPAPDAGVLAPGSTLTLGLPAPKGRDHVNLERIAPR